MNIMMFCSNPVNGGTAKIFYELTMTLENYISEDDRIFAAVDFNNTVDIYDKISFLDRLKVYSEEEICKGLYGGNIVIRVVKKILRCIKYKEIKKENIARMSEYLYKNKIDCVVIHNGSYVGDDLCNQMLEASFNCRNQVTGRILVLHNDFRKNFITKVRYRSYDKKISKEATELVTVSNYTRKRLLDNSFISSEIKVIFNGLPEHNQLRTEEKEEKLQLDRRKKNILMLGNFQVNKGQLQFIEAAKLVKLAVNNSAFTFIGNVYDERYYNQCTEKIRDYGLEKMVNIFHGINNAAEYIDMFDLVVVPSMYDESFGLISVEAMSKGTPVVAFACGGIPEVLPDGIAGFLVPIGDTRSMANKIISILNDKDLCKRLGIGGRNEYLNRFSVNVMGKQYYDMINGYRNHD